MYLYHAIKKSFALVLMLCGYYAASAQSVSPQVINVAGGGGPVGASGIEVYYNIGEPFYTTINNGNHAITQGFLQPDVIGKFGLTAGAFITHAGCADKADGVIKVVAQFSGVANPDDFQISYYWNSPSLCSTGNTCTMVENLPPGTYSVTVVSHYTGSGNALPDDTVKLKDIVVSGSSEPCQITVYNGFSPNGDGINDVFYIENIGLFPGNSVEIFNRWGQKLAELKEYDNTNKVWTGTVGASGQQAPAGTYFYVIDLGNGTAPLKGWLELTNNR
jgi:gliding motility-associated-like protein